MEWRLIDGWPYQVSEDGQVRNIRSGHVLKQRLHASGYLVVQLWQGGDYWTTGCHQLAAAAFKGPKPSKLHEVAHRDGNRINNHHDNLRWALHADNMVDRDNHGTTAISERNGKTKYPDDLVRQIKAEARSGQSLEALSESYNIPLRTIHGYVSGLRRTYIE